MEAAGESPPPPKSLNFVGGGDGGGSGSKRELSFRLSVVTHCHVVFALVEF